MMRFFLALVMLLVVSASGVRAQPLPVDQRLTIGECENGLKYIVVRHRMPPLRAQVWLHVGAGSMAETDQQRGGSHFLSHMAFKGSENMPPDVLAPVLLSLGSPAPDVNSHTTFDESVYKLNLRDATTESVGSALRFLKEIATGLSYPETALEAERSAILAEQKAAAGDVKQRVQEFLLSQISPGSIIGDRLRTGTPDSVKALKADDLRAFHRRWYVPSNMTVIFVGDVEVAEVVKQIQGTMGKGPKTPAPATPDLIKPTKESRAAVFSDAELTASQGYIFHVLPARAPVRTFEDLRERVIDSVAVDVFNRRMKNKIAMAKFPHQSAGATASDIAGVCQLVGVYVSGDAGAWREAIKNVCIEVQRARLHGFFASEIEESKSAFLSQWETNVKNDGLRQGAAFAATLSAGAGNGDVIMSPQQTLEHLKTIFAAADQKVVSERFARMMDPAGAMFLLAVPSVGEVPKDADVLAAGLEAAQAKPEAETEFIKPTALMNGRPTPGKIVEEKTHEATGVWSGWLENGVLVHHRKMNTAPGHATVTVAITGGVIEETDLTRGLTEAGSVAWSQPATSKLPSFVVRELTEEKIQWAASRNTEATKLRLGGGPGLDNQMLVISGPVENLETGLQLLHLMLTDPVIEPPGLAEWKRGQLQTAEGRYTQAKDVFSDGVLDMLYPKSELRIRPLTQPQIERVTLEAAQSWVRRQTVVSPIEVSVVGDIEKGAALDLVTTYFGSLPKRERVSTTTFDDKRKIEPVPGPHAATREAEGLTDSAFIMVGFKAADAENMADTRLLGLASAILNERIVKAMQPAAPPQGPGQQPAERPLIQNAAVRSQPAQEFYGTGVFGTYGLAEKPKAEEAAKYVFSVYDAFAKDGPTVEELASAKQQVSVQLDAALANPDFWSEQLSLLTYRARNLDDMASAQTPYQTITPEEVKAGFAKYYTPESRMQLVLVQKVEVKIEKAEKVGPEGPEKK